MNNHNANILIQRAEREVQLVSIQVLAFGHSRHPVLKRKDTHPRDSGHLLVKFRVTYSTDGSHPLGKVGQFM